MRLVCPYCEYDKPDKTLDMNILEIMHLKDTPKEDYRLYVERLTRKQNLSHYNGVKVHIGKAHKGLPNWPDYRLNDKETKFFKMLGEK